MHSYCPTLHFHLDCTILELQLSIHTRYGHMKFPDCVLQILWHCDAHLCINVNSYLILISNAFIVLSFQVDEHGEWFGWHGTDI
jgi:hypothetical protein